MARSEIAESLLEMHYFRVLVCHYRSMFPGKKIEVFKPSTSSEHWYGFDQAYFRASVPKPKVIEDIKAHIHRTGVPTFTSFRAFFLQFKVVEKVKKLSALSPALWASPYYRSELYLEPNKKTGISQHEALRRLVTVPGASVSYACPMIFDENDTLKRPRLGDIRFVDVASSPSGWLTAQRHFIAFQSPLANPFWCSDPTEAKSLNLSDVIRNAKPLGEKELFALIDSVRDILSSNIEVKNRKEDELGTPYLPACFSIVAEVK